MRHLDFCPQREQGASVARQRAALAGNPGAGLGNRSRPVTPTRVPTRTQPSVRFQRPSALPPQRTQGNRPQQSINKQANKSQPSTRRGASSSQSRSSAKEAVEEMDVHDKEAAEDEAEVEDAANKATEEEDQARLEQDALISYCLALKENQ